MKINFDVEVIHDDKLFGSRLILNNRWVMYDDGVIYDTQNAKDIPQWIFEFRDFVLENSEKMKIT